ncbi:MAG: methylenetetrahydrofolate reductase [Deltaproteobacteria bacterium]|nr:methylenetetrahydrofolate reductase [Deltaproteobacteria bacterium]MBW2120440.1 methylenetetrahydrofolate reductase [Deltaproteobacteria bacterium]
MRLKSKLDRGQFAILAEMEPPKGVDVSAMVSNAARVKENVDAFVIPDMNDAVVRMSALGGAAILQGKGMETVMQVGCRDRNRLALQADLLAAHACGVGAVMAVKGEDPSFGDHYEARAVYDLELLQLLDVVQKLQQGQDMAGGDLAGSPEFLVGSTVNGGARGDALELELEELGKKIEKGARFFVTPPVFDIPSMDPFLKRVDRKSTHIIPTVLLLKSVGMARYIQRHRQDIRMPEALIERIQKAPDRAGECTRIAAEMVSGLKDKGFSGVLLSAMGWEDRLPEILERAGEWGEGQDG